MICRKLLLGFLFLLAISFNANARNTPFAAELDTVPVKERYGDFLNNKKNPFDLKDPSIIQKNVEYDAKSGQYIISEKIGDDYYRMPTYMTFSEYLKKLSHLENISPLFQPYRMRVVCPFRISFAPSM